MASIQIPNLPAAVALSGAEQLEIVQGGASARTTTQAIANLSVGSNFGAHGAFHHTLTQTSVGANQINKAIYNTTDLSNGVSVVSNSQITVVNAGIYNFEFSAQIEKTSGGSDNVDIWIQINGSNVADSNTRIALTGGSAKQVAAWNFLIQLAAGQYVELCWSSPSAAVQLHAEGPQVTPTRPGIPSIIASLFMVKPL
jgi:hypothetical protein